MIVWSWSGIYRNVNTGVIVKIKHLGLSPDNEESYIEVTEISHVDEDSRAEVLMKFRSYIVTEREFISSYVRVREVTNYVDYPEEEKKSFEDHLGYTYDSDVSPLGDRRYMYSGSLLDQSVLGSTISYTGSKKKED